MMWSVAEPSTICTSSSPFGWRSHAPSPENLALKMLPSRYGASVAKPPLPFRSPSVICGVRPRSSFSLANSALRSRMVIILPSSSTASTRFVPAIWARTVPPLLLGARWNHADGYSVANFKSHQVDTHDERPGVGLTGLLDDIGVRGRWRPRIPEARDVAVHRELGLGAREYHAGLLR